MVAEYALYLAYMLAGAITLNKIRIRLQLSRAKHPSLAGHSKMSRRVARLIPYIEYDDERFFDSDNAPQEVVMQRRMAFDRLERTFNQRSPESIARSETLEESISDVLFTNTYRVPFPYRQIVKQRLKTSTLVAGSHGTRLVDLDGNESYDLSSSYGVNIFGYEFYKSCLKEGYELAKDYGPVLGPYHPAIEDNVRLLKNISGLDEVSFHMSGTEAVMQAVRLARYHTGKSHLVRFCGSYHGWWDGVQVGIGNNRKTNDVYTLKEMSEDTLKVLRTRKDIACILINPLQALHPNSNAPGDATLISSDRHASYDHTGYSNWLKKLRQVCNERGIVMIMDEVFVGFRLAQGGAQEYFRVQADMVTYGKGLGGGLPVGVLCGKRDLMKRFRDDKPSDISFARGTFNSHPYVMTSMYAFLQRIQSNKIQQVYKNADTIWKQRMEDVNTRFEQDGLPVKITGIQSIWMVTYTRPCRYNWMYQYYMRAAGLMVSWIGSGRLILPHNLDDEDFIEISKRLIEAARTMQQDGWFWHDKILTNKSIKRSFLKELIRQKLGIQKKYTRETSSTNPVPVEQ